MSDKAGRVLRDPGDGEVVGTVQLPPLAGQPLSLSQVSPQGIYAALRIKSLSSFSQFRLQHLIVK